MKKQIVNASEYLYLELCKVVVAEFEKHSQPLTDDLCALLENVLMAMEQCFQERKKALRKK